jgi:hypothetical protein
MFFKETHVSKNFWYQYEDYLHCSPITTPPGPDGLSKIISISIMIPGSAYKHEKKQNADKNNNLVMEILLF